MIRRKINYTLCVIMVGSSVSMWAMEGLTIVGTNSQEGHAVRIHTTGISSGTGSPVVLSKGLLRRRNSAPDAVGGSYDLRKTLAALILQQDSVFNERQAAASPSGSVRAHCPGSPSSSDEQNPILMAKTPETPATPVGYILSSVEKTVIEVGLKKEYSNDGCVIERTRCFLQETFSRSSTNEAQDYGTIHLRIDLNAKKCSLDNIELNKNLIASDALKASITRDLELRATTLAAERQKELEEETQ
jgi:hypothetical protein